MSVIDLSVIMCTYQGKAYLQEQLDSILAQTLTPLELIVLDDQSMDGTYEWLAKWIEHYQGPVHIQIQQNPQRLGSIKSFEKALQMAQGSWVAFADQDDYWHQHKLEQLWALNKDATLVMSDAELMDAKGQPLGQRLWQKLSFDLDQQKVFEQNPLEILKNGFVVTGAAMMVRRLEALECVPFPQGLHHDAWIAWNLALKGFKFKLVPECLWKYRIHEKQQVGVGVQSGLRAWLQRFLNRDDLFLHKLILAFETLLCVDDQDSLQRVGPFIEEKIGHLKRRYWRQNTALSLLIRDALNGAYTRHSGGIQSFVKDLLVNLAFKCGIKIS